MTNKQITEQDYLAQQQEHKEAMDHYDKDGYCEFCSRHRDDGIHYQCWK